MHSTTTQLTNITNSKLNDMFTPKPAKLDKHIHWPYGGTLFTSITLFFLKPPAKLVKSIIGFVTGICYQIGVRVGIPLHSPPQCTHSTRNPFMTKTPNALRLDLTGLNEKGGNTLRILQVSKPFTTADCFRSYKYSKILTTATHGSVSSSTTIPQAEYCR